MNVRFCLVVILCTFVIASGSSGWSFISTGRSLLAEEPPAKTRNQTPEIAATEAFFETKIRPVLVNSCYRCHGDTKVSGGLRVDSRAALLRGGDSGPAMIVGKASESLLVHAIERRDDVSAMPPDRDRALRPDEIRDFKRWIDTGAHWPAQSARFESQRHWAFIPPQRASHTDVSADPWCQTWIDEWIRRPQRAANVSPAPRAAPAVLLRRVTFDLTGLPPTPDELQQFEQDLVDSNFSAAWDRVIERLLSSRAYGERWARHWLDVVRYADTAGETADYPVPLAWRYRNYVIDAFQTDKPYDQFLQEQIAGDILATQGPPERYAERVTATGFLAISRRFGFDSENYHHLTIQDTIDTIGQSVLGLSLGCARCHDHKFDAISIQDYYALYGIFASSRYAFPGSEQKQRVRTLAPLIPPTQALVEWRNYQAQLQQLATHLTALKQPVANVVLRSLVDCDGDFELQAPAAGGSNGVLVPPWLYHGTIAVTTAAQSPYKNVYSGGRVGASIPASSAAYRIEQTFQTEKPHPSAAVSWINLDLRLSGADAKSEGTHRVLLGAGPGRDVCELVVATNGLHLRRGEQLDLLAPLPLNQWLNLQLAIHWSEQTISGRCGAPGAIHEIAKQPLPRNLSGHEPTAVNHIAILGDTLTGGTRPALELDNFLHQTTTPNPVSLSFPVTMGRNQDGETSAINHGADPAMIEAQLRELAGRDGDFELQTRDGVPTAPWNPGPNSAVKIIAAAQSPYRNIYSAGQLGVHLPNRAPYDGFGWTVPDVKADPLGRLHVAFDFRLGDQQAGGEGSWRYYIGQGAGTSAAVELFFNGSKFFKRSGDTHEAVATVQGNRWYQVRLLLDLKAKTYTAQLATLVPTEATPGDQKSESNESVDKNLKVDTIDFAGQFAAGWNGRIDYSFIDSYGHLPGTRPALDADNFVLSDQPLAPLSTKPTSEQPADRQTRQAKIAALQRQLEQLRAGAEQTRRRYEELLMNGPFPLTYGMAEGTPHDVPVQLRGEPDQLGAVAPRGFLKLLGGAPLPPQTLGSGRHELALWLTQRDNPLTARVMVNRIWQYHFGRGLVKTPNDFGSRGQPPTHPELLDALAVEFMEQGWSVKAMHRLILRSAVYQQNAQTDSTDLYQGFQRRRLSAEEIRDAILAVTGQLDSRPGEGHTFPSPLHWGFTQHGPFSAVYEHRQRSIYLMTQRLKRHPYLALFDGADPNATTAIRLGTTVPTQALFFLNDPFLHASAQAWSTALGASQSDDLARLQQAYRQAFGRAATEAELQDAQPFLKDYAAALRDASSDVGKDWKELTPARQHELQTLALAAYLRSLIGSNEFLYLD